MISLAMLIWLVMLFVTHEYGHVYVAKKQEIYKGWCILPQPLIKLTRKFNSRWDYLSGLWGSLLSLPIWIFTGYPLWMFIILIIACAIIDIFTVWYFPRVSEPSEDKQYQKWLRFEEKHPMLVRWHIL